MPGGDGVLVTGGNDKTRWGSYASKPVARNPLLMF